MKLTHAVTNVTLPLTLTDRYGYHSSHGYYLNNNIWGLNPSETNNQITMIDGISTSGVAYHVDWSFPGSNSSDRRPEEDYEVKSYPYAGLELGDEKRLVEDVGSLWTKAEWGYYWPEREGRANVAIDIFTAEDADRDISGGDYELMIWYAPFSSSYIQANRRQARTLSICPPNRHVPRHGQHCKRALGALHRIQRRDQSVQFRGTRGEAKLGGRRDVLLQTH